MKQWDIYSYRFRDDEHPAAVILHAAVILSPDEQCLNPDVIELNVLFAASTRPLARAPKPIEIILDESDGLDRKTAVRCHRILLVPKRDLVRQRGHVTTLRQREICRKIAAVFRFSL